MNTGQFQQSPYGYYVYPDIPPPPPPPVNRHKQYRMLISILIALGLVVGGGVVGVVATHQFSQTPGQTQAELHPTPTQDMTIALESSDFQTFLEAFATAVASKDYADIQKATDTQNFQYIRGHFLTRARKCPQYHLLKFQAIYYDSWVLNDVWYGVFWHGVYTSTHS